MSTVYRMDVKRYSGRKILLTFRICMAGYDILKGIRTTDPADLAEHGVGQIGLGSTGYISPEEALKEWISSPIHKADILDSSIETIGACYLTGSYGDGVHSTNEVTSIIVTLGPKVENILEFSDEEIF